MTAPYFATGYIRVLYRHLQAEGVTPTGLFKGTGFSELDLLRTDFDMPFAAEMRFCENALALTPPGLGLRSGRQLQLAAHGTLGTAMQTSDTLGNALRLFTQLLGARANFFTTSLVEDRERATIEIVVEGLPDILVIFFTETILQTLVHCVSFYTGSPDHGGHIAFSYSKPGHASDYNRVFGDAIEFGFPTTRLTLPCHLLDLPSPEADPVAHAESVQRCLGLLRRQREEDVRHTIESFLLDNPGKLWSLEEVAALFSISARTLMRRLKSSGTSYQEIRDAVLMQQATSCLNMMTVEATANALGFSDSSSFRRTYKRWFGGPPR